MKWYIIILIIVVLLFLPIPIWLKLTYNDSIANLYIYKFKIDLNKLFKKTKEKAKTSPKARKLTKSLKKIELSLSDIKFIINRLNCIRFKPTLRINLNINYGLSDASITGIFYGVISTVNSLMHNICTIFFKVKKYSSEIKPEFQKLDFKAEITSIIFISIAKIIYILIILLKTYKNIKKRKTCS
jgi:hypothetical protein